MSLIERAVVKEINKFIASPDIIVLHGARQVGKTCILKYVENELITSGKRTFYIDLEDFRFVELLHSCPQIFIKYLEGKGMLNHEKLYVFIDEIQYLSNPSNFLKLMHDHYADRIKLIVSGSSSFEIKSKFKDSLVGRTLNFEILPLSFQEFLIFKRSTINLDVEIKNSVTIEELKHHYKEYITYGGYPRITLEKNVANKELYLQQVIDTYIRKDIRDLASIKDILKFNKLLEILASQCGQLLNVVELSNTARLSRPTVEHYLFLLQNTYIIKLISPFSSNLRSELFKTPKIFFYDTGIAHLLWLKTFPKTIIGKMFETSIFAELMKHRKRAEIFYWRTQDKKEIDFIISRRGKTIPVEAKINQHAYSQTAIKYFLEKYHLDKGICVSLEIQSRRKGSVCFYYPWELIKIT